MMNEMELFIEMLDEQEVDRVLKFFKENPQGTRKSNASLEQKKMHIKKVFKSMTPNMIRNRKKGGPDPFYTFINNYKLSEEKGSNFLEHLVLLNENKEAPSFLRYANILLTYPQETRERLKEIEKNLNQGKDPLDLGDEFQSVEELKEYIRKVRAYIGDKAPTNIVEILKPVQRQDYQEQLKKCKKQIKDYDYLRYYLHREELKVTYGYSISHAAYIETHPDEDYDILMMLSIEAMYDLLLFNKNEPLDQFEEKLNNIVNKYEDETTQLKIQVKTKDEELANFKTASNKTNKKHKKLEEDYNSLQQQIVELNQQIKEQKREIEKMVKEHEKQLKHVTQDSQLQLKTLEKNIELKSLIDQDRKSKFQTNEPYESDWGILCISNFEIIKEIYPEVPIYHAEDKNQTFLKDSSIKTIYLLMNSLSTRRFKSLNQAILKNQKECVPLEFDSCKELIEWIGYMKTHERKGVKI
jgi:hypothetical protein